MEMEMEFMKAYDMNIGMVIVFILKCPKGNSRFCARDLWGFSVHCSFVSASLIHTSLSRASRGGPRYYPSQIFYFFYFFLSRTGKGKYVQSNLINPISLN